MRIQFITEELSSALQPKKNKSIVFSKGNKNNELHLELSEKIEGDVKLRIYSYLGDKIKEEQLCFKKGKANFKPDLPIGMYVLSFQFGNNEKESHKLIIKNKKARNESLGLKRKKKKLIHNDL
jgi:hypothetical protein